MALTSNDETLGNSSAGAPSDDAEGAAIVARRKPRLHERAWTYFFGDDVFISYGRRDGSRYAQALARALIERGISFYRSMERDHAGRAAAADTANGSPQKHDAGHRRDGGGETLSSRGRRDQAVPGETRSGRTIKALNNLNNLNILINGIEFGPTGHLAIGGKFGGQGFGRVVFWELPLASSDDGGEPNLKETSFDNPQIVPQQTEVSAVAPGGDSTYFAADGGVWKRTSGALDYTVVARLPSMSATCHREQA